MKLVRRGCRIFYTILKHSCCARNVFRSPCDRKGNEWKVFIKRLFSKYFLKTCFRFQIGTDISSNLLLIRFWIFRLWIMKVWLRILIWQPLVTLVNLPFFPVRLIKCVFKFSDKLILKKVPFFRTLADKVDEDQYKDFYYQHHGGAVSYGHQGGRQGSQQYYMTIDQVQEISYLFWKHPWSFVLWWFWPILEILWRKWSLICFIIHFPFKTYVLFD